MRNSFVQSCLARRIVNEDGHDAAGRGADISQGQATFDIPVVPLTGNPSCRQTLEPSTIRLPTRRCCRALVGLSETRNAHAETCRT